MPVEVVVAVVTGGFSVVVALLARLNRENRRDHHSVERSLGRIEGKLDAHLEDHRAED